MIIQICVGSSCCIKGSERLVEMFDQAIALSGRDKDITLAGSFCIGKCSPVGVTVQVNDDIHVGVTPEGFRDFWSQVVLPTLAEEDQM